MKVYWNDQFIEATKVPITYNDRGYQYGDGLFETMMMHEGKINLLELHWERLKEGMAQLAMEDTGWLKDPYYLQGKLADLAKMNQSTPYARIKLQITRKPGGLFTPADNGINVMGTSHPLSEKEPGIKPKIRTGVSKKTTLYPSFFSKFKTCNALPYVMAGMERKKRGLDDLVLLDFQENVAECCAANIFWLKNNQWFTPSLDTGCVEGVMRKNIINHLYKNHEMVKEVKSKVGEVLQADLVMACNATGIYPFEQLEDIHFNSNYDRWLTGINQALVKI